MAITIASARVAGANEFVAKVAKIALCTGNPGTGTTPANEVTGGGYARLTPSWGTATDDGTKATATAAELEFDVPSGVTVTHISYLDASNNQLTTIDSTDVSFTSSAGKLRVTAKHSQA